MLESTCAPSQDKSPVGQDLKRPSSSFGTQTAGTCKGGSRTGSKVFQPKRKLDIGQQRADTFKGFPLQQIFSR